MDVIDLNADVGEWDETGPRAADAELMPLITSANVACGGHAGSPLAMRETLALAAAHGVANGAHPGFADRAHFGRRERALDRAALTELVRTQVLALAAVATGAGLRIGHVKPHGALYNMAARDPEIAAVIAGSVAAIDRGLVLVGLAGSALIAAGQAAGLRTAAEAFADRAYLGDGTLAPRSVPGSVLEDAEAVAARAVRMVCDGWVTAIDGRTVRLAADTLCVHGDTPGAVTIARRVRQALEAAGVSVSALR